MSKRGTGPAPTRELNEGLIDFLAGVARFLLWAGIVALVIGVGFLVYTVFVFGSGAQASQAQALSNVAIFDKFVLAGVLALAVSTTYLFWGESILPALQLMAAAILYLAPLILSFAGLTTATTSSPAVDAALGSLVRGGLIAGSLALAVLVADLTVRLKTRADQGSKADLLRYGKGVKEEVDRHNVFLGKCWQLPFCRKFVRERCPIYHARRTCWRELTGCMCEEEVIRNAMENKPIPKDQLMAATYIPRNMKLSVDQKRERCKTCVIYNEHQKHKYKAAMPLIVAFFVGIYILAHEPLLNAVGSLMGALDRVIGKATYGNLSKLDQPTGFKELLLACFMLIVLAYSMKILEYVVFKLKV